MRLLSNGIQNKKCFGGRDISTLSDKWAEKKRVARNSYFEHVNPKLGQLKEKTSDLSFLRSLLVPDNFSMWFGVAAATTGLLLLLNADFGWFWQLLLIVSIVFIAPIIARLISSLFSNADNVLTVYPGKQYVGKKVTLEKAIEEGVGEIVLNDETWVVQGDDSPSGTRVKIVAIKKNILYVVNAMGSFEETDSHAL